MCLDLQGIAIFLNFFIKKVAEKILVLHICTPKRRGKREFSSVGSEHLPYKQRVGGSNPSTPTIKRGANF